MTQIGGSIGNFHNWPLDVLGRVEYFEEHWYALTMEHEKCSQVFDNVRIGDGTHDYQLTHAMKQMGKHNIESDDVDGDHDQKQELKQKGLSAEHLVFMNDKQLFDKAVEYYYQDFVCFGYDMTHQGYIKHLNDKYYIA